MAYAYTGAKAINQQQPTLVLVHGALHDHSVWALQSRWFAHHGFNVLALDLPGHMRSTGVACSSVEAYATWVLELLQQLGIAQFAIAGHSMGSLIALECIAQAPERITHLGMVGSAYPMKVSPELLDLSLNNPAAAMRMVNNFSISSIASKPSAPGPGAWLHGGNLRLMERVQAQGKTANGSSLFHYDFVACNSYSGGEAAAAKVTCPALFVLGNKDSMTPARAAKTLQTAIASSKTVMLDSGHNLMAERPDEVLAALRGLLKA